MTYIDSQEFAVHAQEFVEATSALVSGRTINIMNTDGIIIASTERERIGDFHQGAKEVAETGKPVRIGKADLYRYPGAREGYNLPIISAGRIIGVVGMYGEEAEISDAANLLCVYVTQYFEQQTRTHQRELEYEIRERLLELYLLGDKNQAETIFQLEDAISIHLRYPAEVVIIRSKEAEGIARSGNARPESIYEILRSERENGRKDIFGIKGNDLIVLHALRGQDREKDPFYAALRQRMLTERGVRISVSSSCHKLEDIPEKSDPNPMPEDKVKELKDWVKQTLGDEVKDVITKGRLVDSPAAVLNADSISPQMRAMLKAMNDSPLPKPVVDFEINTKSPVIKNLAALKESSPELAKLVLEQIFDNALLSAGLLENTTEMSKRLNEILAQIKA